MICRIWRGWTTPGNADAYQAIVHGAVIPGIEAMKIAGLRHIDLMRAKASDDEVEFATIMWFDNLQAIVDFVGEDYMTSHVPENARAVLKRFDAKASHYEVIDRRPQRV